MAGFIPEEKISEIKNRADIVDIVSEAVMLKKAGRNFQGLCPFHSEKTPSFSVSPEKQIFYCFGCGTGGNVFSFLMKMEGLTFPESVRRLAGRYGIEIPTKRLSADQRKRLNEREGLFTATGAAMEYYHQRLSRSGDGASARKYLEQRQISGDMIDNFRLGYAPSGWDHLLNFFTQRRVSLRLAEKTGLIVPRKNQSGFYDRFRERIVFPIFNLSMQVIGFGGRVLDDALPKYLNSPESPIYNKSRSLYGLHRAKQRCRETKTAYIVEGYFDLLRLHQFGIENSLATLGTALTEDHIRLLKGYAQRVYLVFDSDAAGIRAARRSIDLFVKEQMEARVIILPSGHDPDSFLLESGYQAFVDASERALGIIPYLIASAVEAHGLSIEGKIRILRDMVNPLAAIEDPVARSLYIRSLSERIGIDEAAIYEKIKQAGGRKQIKPTYRTDGSDGSDHAAPAVQRSRGIRFERRIISMMFQFPDMISELNRRNILDYFEDASLKSIGQVIIKHQKKSISEIIQLMEDKDTRCIAAGLAIGEEVWDRDGCKKLIAQYEKSQHRDDTDLLAKIKSAERNNDEELLLKLLRQKQMNATPS